MCAEEITCTCTTDIVLYYTDVLMRGARGRCTYLESGRRARWMRTGRWQTCTTGRRRALCEFPPPPSSSSSQLTKSSKDSFYLVERNHHSGDDDVTFRQSRPLSRGLRWSARLSAVDRPSSTRGLFGLLLLSLRLSVKYNQQQQPMRQRSRQRSFTSHVACILLRRSHEATVEMSNIPWS